MKFSYLLGDSQPQPRTTGGARSGGIQPEEFLENHGLLLFWYLVAQVPHYHNYAGFLFPGVKSDGGIRVAVADGIAQQIVKNPG